ncbi:6-phosphogluconolactonase [Polaribacter glomeratus]|uniref:6-phosphogluconolactonase n=1 Tax=Polaribacter glomeratus TaxID=102 RepID=A0A2S7WU23_9FLAO|nr:6-phosphogluconolactonase [Polaribacter glomeratus]PQJ81094.1 6-phosphogluconolactonase [Polaribacter glomeratus]TXD65646.1 6-phosphogluconolactonase [Polaribacter glomeratus]
MDSKILHKFKAENFTEKVSSIIEKRISDELKLTNRKLNVALSGGTTPIPILEELKKASLDWERINFFLVDERCVPISDGQSNFGNIHKVFFSHINASCYAMVNEVTDVKEAASQYEQLIKTKLILSDTGVPKFDLILLGMGGDGHIASLFPQTIGLLEDDKLVFSNYVPQLNSERITFSYKLILNANHIFVIAKGEEKEVIMQEVYSKKVTEYPISRIAKEYPNLIWLIA